MLNLLELIIVTITKSSIEYPKKNIGQECWRYLKKILDKDVEDIDGRYFVPMYGNTT